MALKNNNNLTGLVKKITRLFPIMLFSLALFTACSESSNDIVEFPDWQNNNLKQWNSIYAQANERIAAGDQTWKVFKTWNIEDTLHSENTSYIVVHVNTNGEGVGSPLYTDSVLVHYKGKLLPSTSYSEGYQFDSSWGSATTTTTAAPMKMLVSSLTDGFATALQHMNIGDDWDVYVPWTLAYGETVHNGIPAYSILIFNIQLVNYVGAGHSLPAVKAKAMIRGTE